MPQFLATRGTVQEQPLTSRSAMTHQENNDVRSSSYAGQAPSQVNPQSEYIELPNLGNVDNQRNFQN